MPERSVNQVFKPDEFFTAEQCVRLSFLMDKWRRARDRDESLPAEEHSELTNLVNLELEASGKRAEQMALSKNIR